MMRRESRQKNDSTVQRNPEKVRAQTAVRGKKNLPSDITTYTYKSSVIKKSVKGDLYRLYHVLQLLRLKAREVFLCCSF